MTTNSDETDYQKISEIEYAESFGQELKKDKFHLKDKKLLKKAYKRAWLNRDFEINKFWHRAAYFWGFLVLIFGAYFATESNPNIENDYLKFYVNCIGIVFSVAWTFVIKGSKRWQENWEGHIDRLEDHMSGPLYKTILNNKNRKFYSVSKINEILSQLIIIVWLAFMVDYIVINHLPCETRTAIDWRVVLGLCITLYFIIQIIFGYGRSKLKLIGKISRRKNPVPNMR